MLTRAALALASAAVAMSGCAGEPSPATKAAPLRAIDPRTNRAVAITPATLAKPIDRYKRDVRRELGRMLGDVRRMRRALAADDLARAKAAWLSAFSRYESIGAAYGAFGDLDAAINGLPGGLQGGVASDRFSGLHRIELALYEHRSTREARSFALRLSRDVATLRRRVGGMDIDSLDFGLRAHEILEDTLHLALAGVLSPWAGAALTALDANIRGVRALMAGLGPIAARTNRMTVELSLRRLDELDHAVQRLRRRDGRFPRRESLSLRERERIDGMTAAAAEQLAYIPALVSTLPPRPALRAIEVSPG